MKEQKKPDEASLAGMSTRRLLSRRRAIPKAGGKVRYLGIATEAA